MDQSQEQWYTNKELFEMMQQMKEEMRTLLIEIKQVTTIIRDYNELRERVFACEKRIDLAEGKNEGKEEGKKTVWGYIIGFSGLIVALLTLSFNR
ncbi:MAG: hypothetical protein ACOX0E_09605 [Syntrophomonadaceae bacterium]